jgi:hypothetical protein
MGEPGLSILTEEAHEAAALSISFFMVYPPEPKSVLPMPETGSRKPFESHGSVIIL